MGGKEKVIIDGVDVRDCEYFRWFDSRCSLVNCQYGSGHPSCENIHNCQYKKLTKELNQKTAECEKYEQALDEIEDIVFGDYEIIDPLGKQQILNIINKAKDGNDE